MTETQRTRAEQYERRDLSARSIVACGVVLLVLVLGSLVASKWLLHSSRPVSQAAKVSQESDAAAAIQNELKALRERESALLNSYQWVSRDADVVRIPIDRAMELIEQNGPPTWRTDGETESEGDE